MTETIKNVVTPKQTFKRKVKNLGKSERTKVKTFITLFQQGGFDITMGYSLSKALRTPYIGHYDQQPSAVDLAPGN